MAAPAIVHRHRRPLLPAERPPRDWAWGESGGGWRETTRSGDRRGGGRPFRRPACPRCSRERHRPAHETLALATSDLGREMNPSRSLITGRLLSLPSRSTVPCASGCTWRGVAGYQRQRSAGCDGAARRRDTAARRRKALSRRCAARKRLAG